MMRNLFCSIVLLFSLCISTSFGAIASSEAKNQQEAQRKQELLDMVASVPRDYDRVAAIFQSDMSKLDPPVGLTEYYSAANRWGRLVTEVGDEERRTGKKVDPAALTARVNETSAKWASEAGCIAGYFQNWAKAAEWRYVTDYLKVEGFNGWRKLNSEIIKICPKDSADQNILKIYDNNREYVDSRMSDADKNPISFMGKANLLSYSSISADLVREKNLAIASSYLEYISEFSNVVKGVHDEIIEKFKPNLDASCKVDQNWCRLTDAMVMDEFDDICRVYSEFIDERNDLRLEPARMGKNLLADFKTLVILTIKLCAPDRDTRITRQRLEKLLNDKSVLEAGFNGCRVVYREQDRDSACGVTSKEFSAKLKERQSIVFHVISVMADGNDNPLAALPGIGLRLKELLMQARGVIGTPRTDELLAEIGIEKEVGSEKTERQVFLDRRGVTDLQMRLVAMGSELKTTGVVDAQTRKALRAWQGAVGFSPTGYLTAWQVELIRERTRNIPIAEVPVSAPKDDAAAAEGVVQKKRDRNRPPREAGGPRYADEPRRVRGGYDEGAAALGVFNALIGAGVGRCRYGRCF